LSKRWNVARLTSEISSSASVGTRNEAVFCHSISATDPAGGNDAGDISAGDPPVDAAKDTPAIPSTDTALLGRFPFEARFASGIAEFLLYCPSTKIRDELYKRMHPLALFCDDGLRFSISFGEVYEEAQEEGRQIRSKEQSTNWGDWKGKRLRGLNHKLVSNEIHGPTWVKRVLPEALASHPEVLLDPITQTPEAPEHPEKPEETE
jgi:hypothetical protein